MKAGLFVLRWSALVALAVWLGGFTVYSAFVIPILEDAMGRFDAGAVVTRHVAGTLNQIGVGTLALWWWLAWAEGEDGPGLWRRTRLGLLGLDSILLAVLFALHPVMGSRLDAGIVPGFYRLHRYYLFASTAQWAVNLALVAVTLVIWQPGPRVAKEAWPPAG